MLSVFPEEMATDERFKFVVPIFPIRVLFCEKLTDPTLFVLASIALLTLPEPTVNADPEYKVIAEELSEPLPVVKDELVARLMLSAPIL